MLALPVGRAGFILDTDASNQGIGVVLLQVQDEQEKVIRYFSHVLSETEWNYCVTHRKLLEIVKAVKFYRHYVYSAKFIIQGSTFELS